MDPKKSLWQKFQTQENHSELPVIKICDWGPWMLNNLSGIHYAGTLTLTLTLTPILTLVLTLPLPQTPILTRDFLQTRMSEMYLPNQIENYFSCSLKNQNVKQVLSRIFFYDLKGKATNFKPKVHCNCFVRLHQRKWYVRSPLHGNIL